MNPDQALGRGRPRLVRERRGLSGGREIALDAAALGGPNLHKERTGFA
jgi:hypothetical protein